MTGRAAAERAADGATFLRKAGQRIVFSEQPNHRGSSSPFSDKRGRIARSSGENAKAILRQQLFEKSGADEYAAAGADLAGSGEALPDDTVLLVPEPFDALYPHVLCARIDAALGETDRYAGEQAQCSGLLSELAVWLRQKHPPRCRAQWRW